MVLESRLEKVKDRVKSDLETYLENLVHADIVDGFEIQCDEFKIKASLAVHSAFTHIEVELKMEED